MLHKALCDLAPDRLPPFLSISFPFPLHPATLASWPFLEHVRHDLATGPLHMLCSLPGVFFSQRFMGSPPYLPEAWYLLKCSLFREASLIAPSKEAQSATHLPISPYPNLFFFKIYIKS